MIHAASIATFVLAGLIAAKAAMAGPEDGEQIFLESCAGCHGATAAGNGPTAALLSVPVPDLTRIAARNDGIFDAARVVRLIDGREGLSAHGGPMPMFGGLLTGKPVAIDASDGSPVFTTERVLSIVEWLDSIQADQAE